MGVAATGGLAMMCIWHMPLDGRMVPIDEPEDLLQVADLVTADYGRPEPRATTAGRRRGGAVVPDGRDR